MRMLALLAVLLAACTEKPDTTPSDGAMPAKIAGTKAEPAPEVPADAPTVAFLGDSIAAGMGVLESETYAAGLERALDGA